MKLTAWKIIFPFIAGAILVGGGALLGNVVSTKIGALFYGFPITILPITFSIWLSSKNNHGTAKVEAYIGQSALSILMGIISFIIPFWISLKVTKSFHIGYIVGLITWGIAALIYCGIFCPRKAHQPSRVGGMRFSRVPLLACPALRNHREIPNLGTAGQASSGTRSHPN